MKELTGWRWLVHNVVGYTLGFFLLLFLLPWLWIMLKQDELEHMFEREHPDRDL